MTRKQRAYEDLWELFSVVEGNAGHEWSEIFLGLRIRIEDSKPTAEQAFLMAGLIRVIAGAVADTDPYDVVVPDVVAITRHMRENAESRIYEPTGR